MIFNNTNMILLNLQDAKGKCNCIMKYSKSVLRLIFTIIYSSESNRVPISANHISFP